MSTSGLYCLKQAAGLSRTLVSECGMTLHSVCSLDSFLCVGCVCLAARSGHTRLAAFSGGGVSWLGGIWGCLTQMPRRPSIRVLRLIPTPLSLGGSSSPEGLDLFAWCPGCPSRIIPTGLKAFLEPLCAWTDLKKGLVSYSSGWWDVINFLVLPSIFINSYHYYCYSMWVFQTSFNWIFFGFFYRSMSDSKFPGPFSVF